MVNLPSSAAQASDAEQKKRKLTFERAKANHLSRQLQMRLQYAKLKVDHGWQRQTLDEVENLYFRHSHMRGQRSTLIVKSPSHPVTSSASQLGSSTSAGVNAHQSLSNSTLQSSPVSSRVPGNNVLHDHTTDVPTSLTSTSQTPNPIIDPAPESSASLFPTVTPSETLPALPVQEPSPSKAVSFLASPRSIHAVHHDSQPTSGATTPTKSSTSKTRPKAKAKPGDSLSPSSAAASVSPYKQSVLLFPSEYPSGSGSRQETGGGDNKNESGSATKGASLGLGHSGGGYGHGSPAMTYDSFWSSHSSATATVRLGGQ